MIGMTMCSGIGAPEVAAPWVDWRFASEIEDFPRAVLQQRFGYKLPADHNQGEPLLWGDMTEVSPDLLRSRGIPLPDLIVAGTPCQAFSIAGRRDGVADERGNLTLKFVEICHAIVDARPDGKLVVLWENVTGVLSDKNNAFGCFLGGLVGADDALHTPDGKSWPGVGMVAGPRARAAWRVFDAQYFGVAQRRRRVFLVVDFGNFIDPAAVLFERQGVQGNPAPRREAGQGSARGFECGPGGGRLTDLDCDGGSEVTSGEISPPLLAKANASHRADMEAIVTARMTAIGEYIADDTASKDGPVRAQTGAGVIQPSGGRPWPADVAPTLNAAFGDKMGLEDQHALNGAGLFVPAITGPLTAGMHKGPRGTEAADSSHIIPVAHTLRGEGFDASEDGTGRGTPLVPVAYDLRGRDGGAQFEGPHDTANIRAASGGSSRSYVADTMAVRRLMPVECNRLQGFPDDHLDIEFRGKPATDSVKYKADGNSMAVPNIKWITDRIRLEVGA